MEVIKLDTNWKYDKIYHISDIHIRNTEQHEQEYIHVFGNLYNYLNSVKFDTSLIVITGDILHNKDRLSPLCIGLCVDFLDNLTKIMNVIIIAGNHDLNERNLDVQDSLSSIVYKRNIKNLYYLKESGVYRFNNILFGVSSLVDQQFINANDIKDNGIKIALFHGAISNSINSHGFEFSKHSVTKFDGYDLTLLGDMHKFQYLNETKTVAYASSLISQTFSETDHYHGILIWNLENLTSEYKIINNDYRFDELDIENDKIIYHGQETTINNLNLAKYCKLRINSSIDDMAKYNSIINDIVKSYPSITIKHNKSLIGKKNKNNLASSDIHETITVESIVKQELESLEESEFKNKIKEIFLEKLNNNVHTNENYDWKLLSLEFSNLLTYGANNKFDFTLLGFDEITGLIGKNSSGKSSIIDILLFALFNKYSRDYIDYKNKNRNTSAAIINNKADTFECRVKFKSNNKIYEIYKYGKRKPYKQNNKNKINTIEFIKYDFIQYDTENNKILMNKHNDCTQNDSDNETGIIKNKSKQIQQFTITDTQKLIDTIIGSYDNFCLASVCFQNSAKYNSDFCEMRNNEKALFLTKLLHLDIFNRINENCSKKLQNINSDLKSLKKNSEYTSYDYNNDTQIEQLEYDINNFNQHKENYEKQKNKYKNNLDLLRNKLVPIHQDYKSHTIDELNHLVKKYTNQLQKCNTNDYISDNYLTKLNTQNIELALKIKQIKNSDIDINESKQQLINVNDEIKYINSKILELNLIQYKDSIINEHQIYEQNKIKKLIEFKSALNNKYQYITPTKIISENYINNCKFICDTIVDNTEIIIETEIILNKLQLEYDIHIAISNNIKNYINNDVIPTKKHIKVYRNIKNYDEYYNNMLITLKNYKLIQETFLLAKNNKDIIQLFDNFNSCINSNCSNCINHSKQIATFYNSINITSYNSIKNEFEKLDTIKKDFDIIHNYHLIQKYNYIKSILEIQKENINYYKNKLNNLQNNNYSEYKNKITEHIQFCLNSNIIYQINIIENSTYDKYKQLLTQLELFNHYNDKLKVLNEKFKQLQNYIQLYENEYNDSICNIELETQINNNKLLIEQYNENKKIFTKLNLIKQTIVDKNNNDIINQQIIIIDKNIEDIKNNYDLLKDNHKDNQITLNNLKQIKNKYEQFYTENNKLQYDKKLYEHISKLSGKDGIPRKIVNIKLTQVENEVNKIIYPFINRKISITKDFAFINIFFDDNKNKHNILVNSSGGMESFIVSLAFKIALTNYFNIPKCSILFIDEGVSALDKEHIEKFNIIADFIKNYYNNIILITHISSFHDYINTNIPITKFNGSSKIVFANDYFEESSEPTEIIITVTTKKKRGRKPKIPIVSV